MDEQFNQGQPATTSALDDASLSIYDTLNKEGFSTEEKIAIAKGVAGLIRSDIDESIKQLQRLKTSF